MKLSIIIPVLNERDNLIALNRHLSEQLVGAADFAEIIVVDGGSHDDSQEIARKFAHQTLSSKPGRAVQMNCGAAQAKGEYLLFLHADTRLPEGFRELFQQWMKHEPEWGFAPLRLNGKRFCFRVIERAICWRSRLSRIATGDQAICIESSLFRSIHGFESIPLMEDVAISRQLAARAIPKLFSRPVTTSSRRWEERGVFSTIFLMWKLRFRYALGADPHELVKLYR